MTCANCGEANHNIRGCYKEKQVGKGKVEVTEDENEFDTETETEAEGSTQYDFPQTQAATQEFEPYGPDVGVEEDPPLRPNVISESQLRKEKLKKATVPTGTRKINFTGDETGASAPTNFPFSPVSTTWKRKEVMPAGKVQTTARKKKLKIIHNKGTYLP